MRNPSLQTCREYLSQFTQSASSPKRLLLSILLPSLLGQATVTATTTTVSNGTQLQAALENNSVTEVILLPGTYTTGLGSTDHTYIDNGGATETNPLKAFFRVTSEFRSNTNSLLIRSSDPNSPATIAGTGPNQDGIAFHVYGISNVTIQDVIIQDAQKGVIFDDSNNSVIDNCLVRSIGEEGIHIRHGSDNCQISYCTIEDTGKDRGQVGEGIYVGTDKGRHLGESYAPASNANHYDYEVDNTLIEGCKIGPMVRAEHIDVKEGSDGTVIRNNYFYDDTDGIGTNITNGSDYTDSFIDLKGINASVYSNIFENTLNVPVADDATAQTNAFAHAIAVSQRKDVDPSEHRTRK